jgi:ribose transport system substrate-binding protein
VDFEECDAKYLVNNYTLGQTIGTAAAGWINEKLGGKCEVAVIDYPLIPDIIARADGIKDAINTLAPNAQIVAQATAATAQKGMEITENFLQAHPNIKVIASIGDGGAIGANEAVKAAGKNSNDFGIFSADATDEALSKIVNGESIRMSVLLDNPRGKAKDIMDLAMNLMNGQGQGAVTYTSQIPITAENVGEYYKK